MAAVSQPTCAACSAPLPWADVDRGAGACRQCGAPFEFHAGPVIMPMPPSPHAYPAANPFAYVPPAQVAIVPIPIAPSGVKVTRKGGEVAGSGYRESGRSGPGEVEIRCRIIGPNARTIVLFTIAWTAFMVLFVSVGGLQKFLWLHLATDAFLIWTSSKQLRNGYRIVVDGAA